MRSTKLLFLFAIVLAVFMAGCSDDDNPAGGGGGGPTYYGTFANPSESGSMNMNFASAPKLGVDAPQSVAAVIVVTGTIKIQGGATITITGTFDTETDSLKISGGGYSFEGTLTNGDLVGSYTGPNGEGSFVAGTSTSGTVKVFLGEYIETAPSPGTHHGKINIVVDGTAVTVLVRDDVEASDFVITFQGTLIGSQVTIYVSGTTGPVLAEGTMNEAGTHCSGTYNSGDEQGDWSADLLP